MFAFLKALSEGHGDVVRFDLGRSPCILVNGALQVRELFLQREPCLRKPEFVKDSNRGHWGDGLTTLEGPAWQMRRQMLRPRFGPAMIARWLSIVPRCTADMLEAWTSNSEVDLAKELRILTARIAARVVLDAEIEGYGPGTGRSGLLPFSEAYGEDFASSPGGDVTAPLVMVRPRAPRRMDATIRIIDERVASGEPRDDVLSDLIQARLPDGSKLTRDEVLSEVIQMLYAGHLTIPSSLVNFWRDVAETDAATRLAAEADDLCATATTDLSALSGCFGIAALKESMRLHPPAPLLYREVEHAFELAGFEFARDVAVWVSPQLLHNDARYFPEPARFLPERFMKDGRTASPGAPYLPFGAGRRVCIANQLALQQMTLIGLIMARHFELRPIGPDSNGFRLRRRSTSG
jgi:cytochrome P450